MGIFSRSNEKPSREKSRKKRAEVCSTFFNKELLSIKKQIQQDLEDIDSNVAQFANRRFMAWTVLEEFLTKFLTQWDDQYIPNGSVFLHWEFYSDVVHYSRFNLMSEDLGKIKVEEILDQIGYLHQSTRQGALVTMPGATLDSSRRYRGYLSANSFSGTMGWDWMNSTENERNFVDNELAALVGDYMTEVFDIWGLKSESGFSGLFAAAVLNGWNVSPERGSLKV